jgi:hypothetical protein
VNEHALTGKILPLDQIEQREQVLDITMHVAIRQ